MIASPPSPAHEREARRAYAALDALIRTHRADRLSAERMAPRVAEALRTSPGVEVRPLGLLEGGAPLLSASGSEGSWCLPAFMAGLRTLTPNGQVRVEEVLDLAGRLGALRVDEQSIDAVRDFLWAHELPGFTFVVAPSVLEVATTLAVVSSTAAGTGAGRAFSAFGSPGFFMNAREVDSASLAEEFEIDVDPLRSGQQGRQLEPSAEDLGSARAELERPAPWARAWLALPFDLPALRPAYAVRRVSARMLASGGELA